MRQPSRRSILTVPTRRSPSRWVRAGLVWPWDERARRKHAGSERPRRRRNVRAGQRRLQRGGRRRGESASSEVMWSCRACRRALFAGWQRSTEGRCVLVRSGRASERAGEANNVRRLTARAYFAVGAQTSKRGAPPRSVGIWSAPIKPNRGKSRQRDCECSCPIKSGRDVLIS